MTQLRVATNQEIFYELNNRIKSNKLKNDEFFNFIYPQVETISDYKMADLNSLTSNDFKKAYSELNKNSEYQKEIKLWDDLEYDN